jgi:predicted NAD-dependent protein-ADP-ribosyltransferase YbiA (DUF1768 family)
MWERMAARIATLLSLFLISCSHASPSPDPRYPAHWWEPADRATAPKWEILPQDCKPGEVILSKRNELGLLSNFAATPFVFHGKRYASMEGFWQATHYPEGPDDPRARLEGVVWPHTRSEVKAMVAFEAKRAGEEAEKIEAAHGIDWVSFEGRRMIYREPGRGQFYELVTGAMWEKIQQNAEVRRVLVATGDLVLKPDHHQEANPPAAWRYYEIYMDFRSRLSVTP